MSEPTNQQSDAEEERSTCVSRLSAEQIAEVERRLAHPGPIASEEEVRKFFARFK